MRSAERELIAATLGEAPRRIDSPFSMLAAPSWRGVDGAIHRCTLADGTTLIAKVMRPHARAYVDVAQAFAAAVWAGRQGIGPEVVHADVERGVLVLTELAEHRVVTLDRALQPGVLEELAALALRVAERQDGARRDVLTDIASLERAAASVAAVLPIDWAWLRRGLDRFADAGLDDAQSLRFCHGDGNVSNLLDGPSGLRLVDWDLSGHMHPAQYAGAVAAESALDDDGVARVARALLGAGDPATLARVRGYALADHLRAGLIGMIVMATAEEPNEYAKYADWRFLLARDILHDPRREEWVGQLR